MDRITYLQFGVDKMDLARRAALDYSRRRFMKALGGAGALGMVGGSSSWLALAADATPQQLTAGLAQVQLVPPGHAATSVWAYNGTVPGPLLRYKQGEQLHRRLVNALPQPTTIHWHGLRLPNAMDGVPVMTQAPVAPGETFDYRFDLPDAGTYWYHPHYQSEEQLGRGLSGALVIDEPDQALWGQASLIDDDQVLVFDDWRLEADASISETFGNRRDRAHAGRIGNWITVNGTGTWSQPVGHGQRLRLRLLNAANARIFTVSAQGMQGWVIALDGMPLQKIVPLKQIALAPGQRADVVVEITAQSDEEALLVSEERDGVFVLADFPVTQAAPQRASANGRPPVPLPANPVAALDNLRSARQVDLLMQGGAMGGMTREMMAAGQFWTFNGHIADHAGDYHHGEPLAEVSAGETLKIRLINETRWPHGMHLHGHHFQRVDQEEIGPLRDTILMQPNEAMTIAFVADNPGDWMLHCHMLGHQAAGMMTWIRVV